MLKTIIFMIMNGQNGHERGNVVSYFIILAYFGVMVLHAFGLS